MSNEDLYCLHCRLLSTQPLTIARFTNDEKGPMRLFLRRGCPFSRVEGRQRLAPVFERLLLRTFWWLIGNEVDWTGAECNGQEL